MGRIFERFCTIFILCCVAALIWLVALEWVLGCGEPGGTCVIPRPHIDNPSWGYVQWFD